jgi:DNA-binding transcriptional MerR regulator
MEHDDARLLLQHAATLQQRIVAIQSAQDLGMPLSEIEEYLDWLDCLTLDPEKEEEAGKSERMKEG